MRLTFRCKRKKEKYGETFMRALKDLQQPIMLSAYKKCIFLILRDLKIFEFNTLSHLMSNNKILEALKPNWLAMTATLREIQTIIIYCIQKFPLKWCMRDTPKLWSQSLTSDRIWLHLWTHWRSSQFLHQPIYFLTLGLFATALHPTSILALWSQNMKWLKGISVYDVSLNEWWILILSFVFFFVFFLSWQNSQVQVF